MKPVGILNKKPEEMLLFPASVELDVYMYIKVLDMSIDSSDQIPKFSRDFGHSYLLFVKCIMDTGEKLIIDLSINNFKDAVKLGFISSTKSMPIWKIVCGEYVAYGVRLCEAICKLEICRKFGIKLLASKDTKKN